MTFFKVFFSTKNPSRFFFFLFSFSLSASLCFRSPVFIRSIPIAVLHEAMIPAFGDQEQSTPTLLRTRT